MSEKTNGRLGVLYIDLNGLKEINDQQMHEAGDRYLRQAAEVLSEVFGQCCYRVGGDEFVVLTVESEQETFLRQLETLQNRMQTNGIDVFIGYLWEESCTDLKALLEKAEQRMYQEKERYHQGKKCQLQTIE